MSDLPLTEQFPLGTVVEDTVTEEQGIVMAHGHHLTGCDRVAVRSFNSKPENEDWYYPPELRRVDDSERELPDVERYDKDNLDFELGEFVRDDLTDFGGFVTTVTFQLYNCPRAALTPRDSETDRQWFDTPRLTQTDAGVRDEYDDLLDTDDETATGAVGDEQLHTDMGGL